MLVLSRKRNESIVIDGDIRITVVSIQGNHVRLGIEAPETVSIFREELFDRPGPRADRARMKSTAPVTESGSSL